jgi:hypothetical protein
MNVARLFALLVCITLAWACLQGQVQAQGQDVYVYGYGGFPYPGMYGLGASPYSLGQIPTPPYFAIHPPVYYSNPVPRTYGYSPYAYPGWIRTPEVAEPEMIENPHVSQPAKEESTSNVKVVRYQLIHNPYVRDELLLQQVSRVSEDAANR